MENLKTLDRDCFYNLLETATRGWDLSETEKRLENALDGNYNCKNTDYNYRKNSFLQSFEDLFRVIQQCTYFIKDRAMDDLLIQSSLYLEELLNNNREKKN